MSFMMRVIKTELRTKVVEKIVKSKRHDYVRGGFQLEETIKRTTTQEVVAHLECGHERKERGSGTVVRDAKKLLCYYCEQKTRLQKFADEGREEMMDLEDVARYGISLPHGYKLMKSYGACESA